MARSVLHRSHLVTVAARDHPALRGSVAPGGPIPPELFCALPHVIRSMDGSLGGTIDPALHRMGLSRRIALTVPYFEAVALVVAQSTMLGSLPVHHAAAATTRLALDTYLPPFGPAELDVPMFWHRRHHEDPAHLWLRDQVAAVMRR
jgi:DNA-binding transcriptional LysR family regulator